MPVRFLFRNASTSTVLPVPKSKGATMVGILIHGDNHFILRGPRPDEPTALRLARHWSVIQIGQPASLNFEHWEIRNQEFRENLIWAVVLADDRELSPSAAQLLSELSSRNVPIDRYSARCW
jgi:hypothetical protein